MKETSDTAPAENRRSASQELARSLTAERAEMLILFCRLAGVEPFGTRHSPQAVETMLQEFCQILVDYVAAGHFALYRRIVNGTERRRDLEILAKKLHPQISRFTEVALDFNDKYDSANHAAVDELDRDLALLGEALATRIDLEDRLLEVLC